MAYPINEEEKIPTKQAKSVSEEELSRHRQNVSRFLGSSLRVQPDVECKEPVTI